jgi:hypothetical protein
MVPTARLKPGISGIRRRNANHSAVRATSNGKLIAHLNNNSSNNVVVFIHCRRLIEYDISGSDGGESLIALMMEAVNTCETSVNLYQTTQRNVPEDIHLQITEPRQF